MPMVLTAQNKDRKQPPRSLYTFVEAQKLQWKEFWKGMDGDQDKITEFAKKSGVEAPEEWCETLHRFLFDLYPSDPLSRHAASATFDKFTEKIADAHVKEPKERNWYTLLGMTENSFIAMLQRASVIDDPVVAIKYLNSRIRDFGSDLYSEFLLAKAPGAKEFKSIASKLNDRAYKLEVAAGIDILGDLAPGTVVAHELWPGETFTVVGALVYNGKNIIAVEDTNGICGYVLDKWNLTLA